MRIFVSIDITPEKLQELDQDYIINHHGLAYKPTWDKKIHQLNEGDKEYRGAYEYALYSRCPMCNKWHFEKYVDDE